MSVHSKDGVTWLTKLKRISERASKEESVIFNNVGHVLDESMIRTIHQEQEGNKARGVDQVDKEGYEALWQEKVPKLIQRIRRGSYKPQPSLVVEIPKSGEGTRPLAMSCYEDKLVQGLVYKVLEAIFEPIFLDCSYGFRAGKSCHEALKALNQQRYRLWDGAIVEIDIKQCFDSLPHRELEKCLRKRISDSRFLRLVMVLVKASKRLPDGSVVENDRGCPQGSKLSPILCNIYLHYILDEWFETISHTHIEGKSAEIRYCDDMVFAFEKPRDAERFYKALAKRLGRYGLQLHEGKSQLIRSGHLAAKAAASQGTRLKSFKFLGFTCYFAKSKQGYWVPKYKSCSKRFGEALKKLRKYLWRNLNTPDTTKVLKRVVQSLRGWVNYHGISDNNRQVNAFLECAKKLLYKWYNRRGRYKPVSWERFARLLKSVDFPTTWSVVSMYTA